MQSEIWTGVYSGNNIEAAQCKPFKVKRTVFKLHSVLLPAL